MKPPIIVTIKKTVLKSNHLDVYAFRELNDHVIYKVRTLSGIDNKISSEKGIFNMHMMMLADTVYNTGKGTFEKNRYGFNNIPQDLNKLYQTVMDIVEFELSFDVLVEKYSKFDVIQAIYLTDKYSVYEKDIDYIDYQWIRYKFGREIPQEILSIIINDYPEKLI